jgi:hypothetical protein
MHAEFPCKFYHTNKECKSGVNCRFSHEAMTPDLRELFFKYLNEINEESTSILGSPPRPRTTTQLPSLMALTVPSKKQQQPPSLMSNLFSQDIDERCIAVVQPTTDIDERAAMTTTQNYDPFVKLLQPKDFS